MRIIYHTPRSMSDQRQDALFDTWNMLQVKATSEAFVAKLERDDYDVQRRRRAAREFAAAARVLIAAFGVRYDGRRNAR